MGDPKRQRRKYKTPKNPWSKAQLDAELRLLGDYGLRNKRELRRHQATLRNYWARARELQALPEEDRLKPQAELLSKLQSFGLIPEGGGLDNVLDLKIEHVLDRRLQTHVFRTGLSKTSQQARQLVAHGHIAVEGRKVTSPSYLIRRAEEQSIGYAQSSRFAKDASDIHEQAPTEREQPEGRA